jgi:hypothetical protein
MSPIATGTREHMKKQGSRKPVGAIEPPGSGSGFNTNMSRKIKGIGQYRIRKKVTRRGRSISDTTSFESSSTTSI